MKKILMFLILFISPFALASTPYPGALPNSYTLYLDSSMMNDVVVLQGFSYLNPDVDIECQMFGDQPKFPNPGTMNCYPVNVDAPGWTAMIDGKFNYTINGNAFSVPGSFWYDPENQNKKLLVNNIYFIYKMNGSYFWEMII